MNDVSVFDSLSFRQWSGHGDSNPNCTAWKAGDAPHACPQWVVDGPIASRVLPSGRSFGRLCQPQCPHDATKPMRPLVVPLSPTWLKTAQHACEAVGWVAPTNFSHVGSTCVETDSVLFRLRFATESLCVCGRRLVGALFLSQSEVWNPCHQHKNQSHHYTNRDLFQQCFFSHFLFPHTFSA